MISEREIAEKFTTIWKQSFPLLTAQYMSVFNEAYKENVNATLVSTKEKVRYDIVSELSFNLCAYSFENNTPLSRIFKDEKLIQKTIKSTAKSIWLSGNYKKKDLILSTDEMNDCKQICKNTEEFILASKSKAIEFRPLVRGYGYLDKLTADLSLESTLVEIKTVNRNFRQNDLKQLIIYLALQEISGPSRWEHGALYNPRSGELCKFKIRSVIYNISGGKSALEAFETLLNSLSREVELDSKF